jgi:tetratricopeptide (TPR) repeat protein
VRATIRQAIHEFAPARADLDRLVALQPNDAQAQLTRAVVATVTGDGAAARESCDAVRVRIAHATCSATLDGLAGHAEAAYRDLAAAIASAGRIDPGVRGWAITALGELALQIGDIAAAERHFREAIAIDPDDHYARAAIADILLDGRASEVPALLAGREQIDALLLRRAIAEHVLREGVEYRDRVRARFAAAAERGDRVHLREEARFVLEVEGDARRALELAKADWNVQKELADARVLAAAALAAGDATAIAPLRGMHDAQLEALIARFQ